MDGNTKKQGPQNWWWYNPFEHSSWKSNFWEQIRHTARSKGMSIIHNRRNGSKQPTCLQLASQLNPITKPQPDRHLRIYGRGWSIPLYANYTCRNTYVVFSMCHYVYLLWVAFSFQVSNCSNLGWPCSKEGIPHFPMVKSWSPLGSEWWLQHTCLGGLPQMVSSSSSYGMQLWQTTCSKPSLVLSPQLLPWPWRARPWHTWHRFGSSESHQAGPLS